MSRTATVTDPAHEFYGCVVVIMNESEWYTHVRPLYHNRVQILTKDQYTENQKGKD